VTVLLVLSWSDREASTALVKRELIVGGRNEATVLFGVRASGKPQAIRSGQCVRARGSITARELVASRGGHDRDEGNTLKTVIRSGCGTK